MGLAPDGGLFMPERIPQVDMKRIEELSSRSFPEMAAYLASLFFDEFSESQLLQSRLRFSYPAQVRKRRVCALHAGTFSRANFCLQGCWRPLYGTDAGKACR